MSDFLSRILLLSAAGAMVGCGDIAAPDPLAEVEGAAQFNRASSWRSFEEFAFAVPLYLDCLDETAVWSGTVRYDDHWVLRPDGTLLVNGQASLLPGATLVGPSGTWTAGQVVSNYVFQDFLVAPNEANVRVVERITWHNDASGAVMDVSFNIHFVIAGNGVMRRSLPEVWRCELRR